jgi:hypothetical protein
MRTDRRGPEPYNAIIDVPDLGLVILEVEP